MLRSSPTIDLHHPSPRSNSRRMAARSRSSRRTAPAAAHRAAPAGCPSSRRPPSGCRHTAGVRCLTVRVSTDQVRRLMATCHWKAVKRRQQPQSLFRPGLRSG
jgi:hypothetical protein